MVWDSQTFNQLAGSNIIEDKRCAPTKTFSDNSCFSLESLIEIASKYNEKNDDKIKIIKDKKHLVEQLTSKFSNSCSQQTCWLRMDLLKEIDNEEIHNHTFRPIGPEKKNEWLSTTHINDVIDQYHNKYSEFMYLGTVPYDFEELTILGLHNIDFKKLKNENKHKLGMVINLDEHHQSGSHWVALYTDLSEKQVYFFDSVGKKPGKKIKKFINKIVKFFYKNEYNENLVLNNLDKLCKNKHIVKKLNSFDIKYNQIQHQFKNSECGVYSINFILRLLNGETFEEITNNIKKDDEMNLCREEYFRNVKIT